MKRLRAPTPFRADPAAPRTNGQHATRFLSEPAARMPLAQSVRTPVKYRIAVDNLDTAMDRLHTTTALICAAEELDARTTLQLRLCIYELAANTVEHGTFTAAKPAIYLELNFTSEVVRIDYRDNADVFLTSGTVDIDLVEEKINTNSKRGLGLYMLNKISSEFEYERSEKWNITTFRLDIKCERETVTKG